ncbi:MAG: metallophosphoesterase family protein [Arcicella sp.]|nr:metallophosphoesterase family protein [Arcicella sp.]
MNVYKFLSKFYGRLPLNGSLPFSRITILLTIFLLYISQSITAQKITRGPYIQMATSTSMMIRWRTDIAMASKINFGISQNSLSSSLSDNTAKIDHQITLDKLTPNTKYFYAVANASTVLQGDKDNFFVTSPPVNSEQKVRIFALGDMGMGTDVQTKVYQQYLKYIGNNYTDLWLLLGDNAYAQGYDWEFQERFFEYYQTEHLMKQTAIFPSPGNHDYSPIPGDHRIEDPALDYFKIFSMPTKGEIGGVPSNSEAYYSYNYANIHFISLDSYGREEMDRRLFSKDSDQMKWLESDLKANKQKWTILYWHHPPYAMGSRNSDTEEELRLLREGIVPLLEKYRVDLVLNGHSHAYERSQMIKGHYGLESTYDSKIHAATNSNGRYDTTKESCPYIKNSQSAVNEGIIYVVNGCGASNGRSQTTYPHDAMMYSNNKDGGSLYLEIEGNRLDAKFITEDGSIKDQFTILKDVNQKQVIKLEDNQNSVPLQASWTGNYNWQHDKSKNKNVTVSPVVTTKYVVQDDQKCLQDEFTVRVSSAYNLKDFNLTVTKNGLAVDFLTTRERGIAHYEIEQQNGSGIFKSVAKIDSKALNQISDKPLIYRYLDSILENTSSINYRIKITDNEGLIRYSEVKTIEPILKISD